MKILGYVMLVASALVSVSCEERTDQTDSGGVLLTVEFVDTTTTVSVNATPQLRIETMEVNSTVADPNGISSSLMDVEISGYEVTFERIDGGTRVPPSLVRNLVSLVPVGGTLTLSNFPIMTFDQMRTPPLSDLLFANGGFDKETNSTTITLDVYIRFFGKTLSGKDVSSVATAQTTVFTQ